MSQFVVYSRLSLLPAVDGALRDEDVLATLLPSSEVPRRLR